jgi:hypothetical protein
MTYNGSPAVPAGLASQILKADDGWAAIIAILSTLTSAWTAFTPTLSNTGFALGNGAAAGRYIELNKMVLYTGRVTMGSTTTFGTGTYVADLPLSCRGGTQMYTGSAYLHDASTASGRRSGATIVNSTTSIRFISGGGGEVTQAVPFTFAQDDYIQWLLFYERA